MIKINDLLKPTGLQIDLLSVIVGISIIGFLLIEKNPEIFKNIEVYKPIEISPEIPTPSVIIMSSIPAVVFVLLPGILNLIKKLKLTEYSKTAGLYFRDKYLEKHPELLPK